MKDEISWQIFKIFKLKNSRLSVRASRLGLGLGLGLWLGLGLGLGLARLG